MRAEEGNKSLFFEPPYIMLPEGRDVSYYRGLHTEMENAVLAKNIGHANKLARQIYQGMSLSPYAYERHRRWWNLNFPSVSAPSGKERFAREEPKPLVPEEIELRNILTDACFRRAQYEALYLCGIRTAKNEFEDVVDMNPRDDVLSYYYQMLLADSTISPLPAFRDKGALRLLAEKCYMVGREDTAENSLYASLAIIPNGASDITSIKQLGRLHEKNGVIPGGMFGPLNSPSDYYDRGAEATYTDEEVEQLRANMESLEPCCGKAKRFMNTGMKTIEGYRDFQRRLADGSFRSLMESDIVRQMALAAVVESTDLYYGVLGQSVMRPFQ